VLFRSLYSDGVITKEELRRFIDCRGFCVTDTDAQQLVDKMDRDKDGRVTYSEVRSINSNFIFSSAMSLSLRASAIIELDKHDLKLLRCGSELTTHMPECVSAIN